MQLSREEQFNVHRVNADHENQLKNPPVVPFISYLVPPWLNAITSLFLWSYTGYFKTLKCFSREFG